MSMIDIKKNALRAMTFSATAALVSACSPSDPDNGTSLTSTSVSGIAIDGYLARATVYADLNNDGRLDAGEPSALTDSDGYFSTSKDNENYCASASTEKHCLQVVGTVPETVTLRTKGGFDIFTGEPFVGQLSAVVSPDANGDIPSQKITPLSSLGSASATLLGLTESQVNKDFIVDESFDAEAANVAFKLHKVAVIYADALEGVYDYFGEKVSFPDSASTYVYDAFATVLAGDSELSVDILGDVFDTVDQRIVTTFNAIDGETEISSRSSSVRSQAVANAVKVFGLIDNAMPSGMSSSQVRARMIGVEMVVAKMIADNANTSVIDAAIEKAEVFEGDLYTALGDGLDIDFTELLSINYSPDDPDYDSVQISGGISFEQISDKELYLEINNTAKKVTGAALLLFDGVNSESDSGDLKLCIKYDDADDVKDFETTGALFKTGEWTKIDDRRVVLSLLGSFDFTLISRGVTDSNRNLFSMSFAGETETWDTAADLDSIATNSKAMDSHQDCKDRLTELDS